MLDSGGAHIGLVTDSATGRTDGFMTPGNTIDITGKKIRSLNADGSGIGSIKFVNVETDAVAATIASLTINDPGACHTGRPSQPYGWDHTGWRSKRITATTTHF